MMTRVAVAALSTAAGLLIERGIVAAVAMIRRREWKTPRIVWPR